MIGLSGFGFWESTEFKTPLRTFFGPDLLQDDNTVFTQTSATTWRDSNGHRKKKPADTSFTNWLQEQNLQPCLSFADFEGSQTGSWKSSASHCQMLRRKPTAIRNVPAISLDEALTSKHTIVKVDVEGSEIQLLSKPREWKNTRLLIFEFSAGRSRRFGAGPLAFAGVLDALRSGGFTHLHLEAKGVATQKFWTREGNVAANLDFMVWVYRRIPGVDHLLVDLCASPEMERLLRELPGKLRNLDGYPEAAKSRKKRGAKSRSAVAS